MCAVTDVKLEPKPNKKNPLPFHEAFVMNNVEYAT